MFTILFEIVTFKIRKQVSHVTVISEKILENSSGEFFPVTAFCRKSKEAVTVMRLNSEKKKPESCNCNPLNSSKIIIHACDEFAKHAIGFFSSQLVLIHSPNFRSFDKGLADRGGWGKEIPPTP